MEKQKGKGKIERVYEGKKRMREQKAKPKRKGKYRT